MFRLGRDGYLLVDLGGGRRHDKPDAFKVSRLEGPPEDRGSRPDNLLAHARSDDNNVGSNCLQLPQFGSRNRASTNEQHAAPGKGHEDGEKVSHNEKGPESCAPPGLVIDDLEN
jgi:hypothetical protein